MYYLIDDNCEAIFMFMGESIEMVLEDAQTVLMFYEMPGEYKLVPVQELSVGDFYLLTKTQNHIKKMCEYLGDEEGKKKSFKVVLHF